MASQFGSVRSCVGSLETRVVDLGTRMSEGNKAIDTRISDGNKAIDTRILAIDTRMSDLGTRMSEGNKAIDNRLTSIESSLKEVKELLKKA